MNNTPLVSIIMPIYNTEKYLDRCLTSVMNNSYTNLEIICINDGSTDHSLDILNNYQRKDSRIQVITQKNQGLSGARNTGIEAATGEYIAFIDSDDWIDFHYIEYLMSAIEENNLDMAMCTHQAVYDSQVNDVFETSLKKTNSNPAKTQLYTGKELVTSLIHYNYAWEKIIKTSFVKQFRFDSDMIIEDAPFMFSMLSTYPEMKCGVIVEPLYYYYQRDDSLFHKLNYRAYLQLASFFHDAARTSQDRSIQSAAYEKSIKHCLNYRYYEVDNRDLKSIQKEIKPLYKSSLKQLKQNNYMSLPKHMIYQTFLYFPYSYRLFRVYNDPDLLKWEMKRIFSSKKKN